METKTDIEVMQEVIRITENFRHLCDCSDKMTATISNVRFADFILLFLRMQNRGYRVRLVMPDCNQCMTIVYTVIDTAIIYIDSEECKRLKPKINLINYN